MSPATSSAPTNPRITAAALDPLSDGQHELNRAAGSPSGSAVPNALVAGGSDRVLA
ncbi:MAG: hypothetical protein ABI112_11480 [Terracoccus sp.]